MCAEVGILRDVHGPRLPLVDVEALRRDPEEVREEPPPDLDVAQRGRGGDEADLGGVGPQPEQVEELAKEVGHLGAGGAPVHVQLVDDEMEDVALPVSL